MSHLLLVLTFSRFYACSALQILSLVSLLTKLFSHKMLMDKILFQWLRVQKTIKIQLLKSFVPGNGLIILNHILCQR